MDSQLYPLPRTQALWFTSLSARGTARKGEKRLTTKSINLIHAAHAKAAQAIEQHFIASAILFLSFRYFNIASDYLPGQSPVESLFHFLQFLFAAAVPN